MRNEPKVQTIASQPYLAIRAQVKTEAEFRQAADSGFPELFGWLREHGVAPVGPPFIRYLALDEVGEPREVELAVPVEGGVAGNERIRPDALPSGDYVTFIHAGPYTSDGARSEGRARQGARLGRRAWHRAGWLRRAVRDRSGRGA
jgi:effector-binding domain-containing protein